jgi:hypothetical protein
MAIDGTWKEVKLKKDKKNGENSWTMSLLK